MLHCLPDDHFSVSRFDTIYDDNVTAQGFATSPPGRVSAPAVRLDCRDTDSRQFRPFVPPILVPAAVHSTTADGDLPAMSFACSHQPRWPPSNRYEPMMSSRYSPEFPWAVFPFCHANESTLPQCCSTMPSVDRFHCALKHQFAQLMAVQLQQPLMPAPATVLRHSSSTGSRLAAATDGDSIWSAQPLNLSSCPRTPEDCDKEKTSICWRPGGSTVNY